MGRVFVGKAYRFNVRKSDGVEDVLIGFVVDDGSTVFSQRDFVVVSQSLNFVDGEKVFADEVVDWKELILK